jgi:hypothetical protein
VFDPDFIFAKAYCTVVQASFERRYEAKVAVFLTNEVLKHFKNHFMYLEAGQACAAELHASNIRARSRTWKELQDNDSCLYCLRRSPQHVLSCRHSVCDNCTVAYGVPVLGEEYCFEMDTCLLCDDASYVTARLKPPTSGTRLLSIDGGGPRGVVPLESLKLIQRVLGADCQVQDFFDLVVGTSSGTFVRS